MPGSVRSHMSTRSLTVSVPEEVLRQIRARARRAQRTVEPEVVAWPYGAAAAGRRHPLDVEAAGEAVTTRDDRALRIALRPIMTRNQSERLASLNYNAHDKGLSAAEQAEQSELLHVYDMSLVF